MNGRYEYLQPLFEHFRRMYGRYPTAAEFRDFYLSRTSTPLKEKASGAEHVSSHEDLQAEVDHWPWEEIVLRFRSGEPAPQI